MRLRARAQEDITDDERVLIGQPIDHLPAARSGVADNPSGKRIAGLERICDDHTPIREPWAIPLVAQTRPRAARAWKNTVMSV